MNYLNYSKTYSKNYSKNLFFQCTYVVNRLVVRFKMMVSFKNNPLSEGH